MRLSQPLPGDVPPPLQQAMSRMGGEMREAFVTHLLGGTSAEWLAGWLERAGLPGRATTIKEYRRSIQ